MLVNKEEFLKKVTDIVNSRNDGYMDAVLTACEELNIDPAQGAKYLTAPIKEKIRAEGSEMNMLPTGGQLDL